MAVATQRYRFTVDQYHQMAEAGIFSPECGGVPEVWIVNREADAVEVFCEPSPAGYREHHQRRRGEDLTPGAFPDLRLSASDILG